MNELILPIEGGAKEESGGSAFGDAMPQLLPAPKNYAADPTVKARIDEQLYGLIEQTRLDRTELNEEWQAIRRMELLTHDDGKRYNGRSDAYLPLFNNAKRTLVSMLSTALFPSDEYCDVAARDSMQSEDAKKVKSYIQYEFEGAGVRKQMKPFLGQLVSYGNSVLKVRYHKQSAYVGKNVKLKDVMRAMFQPRTVYEGLHVSTRPIFNVYVYPNTADSLDEATLLFEDIDVPKLQVERLFASKDWLNKDEAWGGQGNSERQSERHEIQQALTGQVSGNQDHDADSPQQGVWVITEVWSYMVLPRDAYVEGEDPNCPIPVFITMVGSTPVRVTRNPYWHQRPPYLFGRTNRHPGMFYGYGVGKTIRYLQYLANDYANQMNDCGIYTLNPTAKVVPSLLAGPLPPRRPGGVVPVISMDAIDWDRPPTEMIQHAQGLATFWSSMAMDSSGAPPILQGAAASKAAKTATGAQILQHNAKLPLQDVVEDIELDVLVQLMKMCWANAQQFRDGEVMATIAGITTKIDPRALDLDATYKWLASSQAVNAQMRNQQAATLMQMVMPAVPLLAQQGKIVNLDVLIRKVWDGLGYRGFEEFVTAMPMGPMGMPGMPGMGGPPGMPGAPGQPPEPTSAVDQGNGGNATEMAPGEGEELGSIRAEADQMAALAGASGGYNPGSDM